MSDLRKSIHAFANEVIPLFASTAGEVAYYPAVRQLLTDIQESLGLTVETRISASEPDDIDLPDLALHDGIGDFVLVFVEVASPEVDLLQMAMSVGRNDRIGRNLARTKVILLSNIRSFGLLVIDHDFIESEPVPPEFRRLKQTVELWSSATELEQGQSVSLEKAEDLAGLIEQAITRYAPIAEVETLARILARQARRAKANLPEYFSQEIYNLKDEFGAALGMRFEGEEGEDVFRSSIVQTVYHCLFARWILWSKFRRKGEFKWHEPAAQLPIPLLGELYREVQNPKQIEELGLIPHLDLAVETFSRVHTEIFFNKSILLDVGEDSNAEDLVVMAMLFFVEPFMETFDMKHS